MDSSISHDPFAPEGTDATQEASTVFPSARMTGAGATPEELSFLEEDFAELGPDDQQSLLQHVAGISESDLRVWIDQLRENGHFDEDAQVSPEALLGTEGEGSEDAGDEDEVEAEDEHDETRGAKTGEAPFDPADLTVDEVTTLLDDCTPEEVAAVQKLEAAGKGRKTIAEYSAPESD